ncbi:hypothetical protein D3C73_1397410 [compost metagenome]
MVTHAVKAFLLKPMTVFANIDQSKVCDFNTGLPRHHHINVFDLAFTMPKGKFLGG